MFCLDIFFIALFLRHQKKLKNFHKKAPPSIKTEKGDKINILSPFLILFYFFFISRSQSKPDFRYQKAKSTHLHSRN